MALNSRNQNGINLTNLPQLKKALKTKETTLVKDLTGQVIIITGSNTGLGKATAAMLAKTGATLVLACRDAQRTLPVVEEIKNSSKNSNIEFMKLDLGDLKSVKEFAIKFKNKYKKLDILINNAGIAGLITRKTTKQGFEMHFGVNHLGHFYLTELLLDVIKRTPKSRIINLSSEVHRNNKMHFDNLQLEKDYAIVAGYERSKICNNLFTKELAKRVKKDGIKVVSVCPGIVATELRRNIHEKWYTSLLFNIFLRPMFWVLSQTPDQGAQTSVYVAVEDIENLSDGAFYKKCVVDRENPEVDREDYQKRLWEISEELIRSSNF